MVTSPFHQSRSLAFVPSERALPSSVERSPLSSADRQGILSWYKENIAEPEKSVVQPKVETNPALLIAERELEAALTGLVLGLLEAQFKGLDFRKIPIDGVGSLIALLTSLGIVTAVKDPNHPLRDIARHVGNVGSNMTAILTYRKSLAWRQSHLTPTEKTETAKVSADPIVDAARNL